MYISDDFGEGIMISSHRSSDLAPIYTQYALRDIQSVNGVVVISGTDLAYLNNEAFNKGQHCVSPEWGKSLHKSTIREMILDDKSFDEILKAFN